MSNCASCGQKFFFLDCVDPDSELCDACFEKDVTKNGWGKRVIKVKHLKLPQIKLNDSDSFIQLNYYNHDNSKILAEGSKLLLQGMEPYSMLAHFLHGSLFGFIIPVSGRQYEIEVDSIYKIFVDDNIYHVLVNGEGNDVIVFAFSSTYNKALNMLLPTLVEKERFVASSQTA